MSKIYEALRKHDRSTRPAAPPVAQALGADGSVARSLEAVYPIVYRLAKEAGHGVVLHFVAASAGEGVSTLSGEFAAVSSRVADSRVLLVDADRIGLATASRFGCVTETGIFDVAQAGDALDTGLVAGNDHGNFQIGALCGQQSPPLLRKAMPMLYDLFRAKYDVTIIDCPSVFSDRYFELSPDAVDGIILVVQAERSRPEIIRQAKTLIDDSGGKLIGSILNRRHTYIPDFLYRLL
jgi:Mrp family chromosome partitioning ATPase